MEITNITNTGTSLAPIINAKVDGIQFTNIPSGVKGVNGATFWNQASNTDVWKANGDASKWKPAVNAVDIDWNGAVLSSESKAIDDLEINTTGQLLAEIACLREKVAQLEAGVRQEFAKAA